MLFKMLYNTISQKTLFHFKADQADYSIKTVDQDTKPLFVDKEVSKTKLNEFFYYF